MPRQGIRSPHGRAKGSSRSRSKRPEPRSRESTEYWPNRYSCTAFSSNGYSRTAHSPNGGEPFTAWGCLVERTPRGPSVLVGVGVHRSKHGMPSVAGNRRRENKWISGAYPRGVVLSRISLKVRQMQRLSTYPQLLPVLLSLDVLRKKQ